MSYLNKTLLAGEFISYRAHVHWWIFVLPILMLLLSIFLIWQESHVVLQLGGGVLGVISLWSILNRFILRITSDFVVTNKRVILKTGMLRRNVSDLQLNKAEGLIFQESITGRILGYGTIIVTTGGITNTYPYIASPLLFRRAINERIDAISKNKIDSENR